MNTFELWAKAIAARNELAPKEAQDPPHIGPVAYNAKAADAPAARRENSIRAACAIAGFEEKADGYISGGIPLGDVLEHLHAIKQQARVH